MSISVWLDDVYWKAWEIDLAAAAIREVWPLAESAYTPGRSFMAQVLYGGVTGWRVLRGMG